MTPYVADELVFGYYLDQFFPLDYENQSYPPNGLIDEINLTEDVQLSGIKLCERITENDHKRLHGIQLFFNEGSASPYFKGFDTEDELRETYFELEPSQEIAGIQMKLYKDELTGIRMFDYEDNFIIDYTWQDHYYSGTWSAVNEVGPGRSIFGLVVNEP